MKIPRLCSIALILCLIGCSSEDLVPSEKVCAVYLGSRQLLWDEGDTETKTTWDQTGSILWSESDRIKVLARKNGKWLDAAAASGNGGGDFLISPTIVRKDTALMSFAVPSSFLADSSGSWKFYGVYPPSCLLDTQMSDSTSFSFRIPTRQVPALKATGHSFDQDADVLVGHTDDIASLEDGKTYPLYWDRLVAHLCVNIKNVAFSEGEEVNSIKLVANNSAKLSGKFSYDISSGTVTAVNATDSVVVVSNWGNLVCTGGTISDVWFSVLPQTITSLKVVITSDRAVYTKSWSGLSLNLKKNSRNILSISMDKASKQGSTPETPEDPNYTMVFDTTFAVSIPEMIVASKTEHDPFHPVNLVAPAVDEDAAVQLHLEVFPMYAFGDGSESGDYYYVDGYIWSHNALIYSDRFNKGVGLYGWYPALYALDFQLLSSEGKPLDGLNNELKFLSTPEPSSTKTDWNYHSQLTISLTTQLTIGMARPKVRRNRREWKVLFKGWLGGGFSWVNSTSQNLPDQTILMYYDSDDREVHYEFKTMNDETGFGNKYIPDVFKTDQIVKFNWIWHVKKGVDCAKDGDLREMKMKVAVRPTYKIAYRGDYVQLAPPVEQYFEGRTTYEYPKHEFVMDMPAINRIPAGKIYLKNDTLNEDWIMTDITVYREGEYATGIPYDTVNGSFDMDETAEITMRYGTYDITLVQKDSGTGAVERRRIIKGVTIDAGKPSVEISYSDGIAL